jgi:hypothetical protein
MAQITKPQGEDWAEMFRDVHVKEKIAQFEEGAKAHMAQTVDIKV